MQSQNQYGAMLKTTQRGFAGGADRPALDTATTDYDILFIGGGGVAGLLKQTQLHEDAQNLKMGFIGKDSTYVIPQVYFNVTHEHKKTLSLSSASVVNMVDSWSTIQLQSVEKLNPETNTVTLDDGRELNYKALVLAPGFDSKVENIPGLKEFDEGSEDNNTFVHCIDSLERVNRNFYNGYYNKGGDLICYSPKMPYKGEGTDFYALYYESFLRQDKMLDLVPQGGRVVYVTPNKSICPFPYANEVILDECAKRGIEVQFGWEMLSIQEDACGNKTMTLRNVDSGETIEKDYTAATVNPTSKPHQWLVDAGVTDDIGMVDVNKYTLQHKKYENIFAFGDCIAGDLTRTMSAVISQAPVVKNNVLKYIHGKEPNGIWDGFSQQILHLGVRSSTTFSHTHDFDPTPMNHWAVHYGPISAFYQKLSARQQLKQGEVYLKMNKDHGEPYKHFPVYYDDLEDNEYLIKRGIAADEVRFQGGKLQA